MFNYFIRFLGLSILLLNPSFAAEKANTSKKVYITSEQLFIDEEGMHITLDQENAIPITALFHDENGYFVLQSDIETYGPHDRYTCPNGHHAPRGDGRCNNPTCIHRR